MKSGLLNLQKKNSDELKKLEDKIEDAVKNFGDTEVREASLAKADDLCSIGAREGAESAYRATNEKTVSLGHRIDLALTLIRVGFFYNDQDLLKRNFAKAKSLIDEGGDWDRKNRLKVYEAYYLMSNRNFEDSARLFLESLASFSSEELFDYKTNVSYTVICSIISLDRVSLRTKVVDSPEVLTVLESLPTLDKLLNCFYDSEYKGFFLALADITEEMKIDRSLYRHVAYFCREMRAKAYAQYISSYSSVQVKSMANSFGVTQEFIDKELSRFIALGKVDCRIDAVNQIICTIRPDNKNAQFIHTAKQIDILHNRLEKLSRVIHL